MLHSSPFLFLAIMKLLVFVSMLLAADAAKLQQYSLPNSQGTSGTRGTGSFDGTASFGPAPTEHEHSPVGVPGPASEHNEHTSNSFAGQFSQSFSAHDGQAFTTSQVTGVSSSGPTQSTFGGATQQFSGSGSVVQSSTSSGQHQTPDADDTFVRGSSVGFSGTAASSAGDCPEGQIKHFDGRCVTPEVTRKVFVYAAPERSRQADFAPVDVPLPRVEHNIVFIRTEELEKANDPIIVPPPLRKDIIYVLNKESEFAGQRVIEITTAKPAKPEVFFVNYADGETPTLPDGTDFETALSSAIHSEGQVIGGSSGFEVRDQQGSGFVGNFETSSAGFSSGGPVNTGFDVVASSAGAVDAFATGGVVVVGTTEGTATTGYNYERDAAGTSASNFFGGASSNQNNFGGDVGVSVGHDESSAFGFGGASTLRDDGSGISSNLINVGHGNPDASSAQTGIPFPANTFQTTQPASGVVSTPQTKYGAP
ncbi:uncharacterized protein [Macrobrachium rosenbergii]|uniref:uncharacterized protein n=1 Tax=Macrobrachium rosenbergii TaxID=79674 RepID=UPI0034D7B984